MDRPIMSRGIDLFEQKEHKHLLLMDHVSGLPMFKKMYRTDRDYMIRQMKSWFSLFGVRLMVRSGNGPPNENIPVCDVYSYLYLYLGIPVRLFRFVFVFALFCQPEYIRICICLFLFKPNLFVFIFALFCQPNIFIFIFVKQILNKIIKFCIFLLYKPSTINCILKHICALICILL